MHVYCNTVTVLLIICVFMLHAVVAIQCLASNLHHLEMDSGVLLFCLVGCVRCYLEQPHLLHLPNTLGHDNMSLVPRCVCCVMYSKVCL